MILDVDTGSDDAIALIAAMANPDFEVLGIMAVNGNRAVPITTENSLRISELMGGTVPVFQGCAVPWTSCMLGFRRHYPMYSAPEEALYKNIHGTYIDQCPPATIKAQPKNAVSWLVDTLMEAEEIVEAFTTLHKAGKVRHFGVSNVNPWQAELLQSWLGDDPAMRLEANQLQFGLMHAQMVSDELMTNSGAEGMVVANHSDGLLSYSRLRHMTIQAWSPFQSGTEYGPFVGNEHFPELNKALDEKGAKYGVSANAIATAWVLRHPAKIQIVLGSMNPTRLGEMLDGADIDLDKQDWWDLYVAAGNLIP